MTVFSCESILRIVLIQQIIQ